MAFPKDDYFKMPNAMFGSKRRRGWIEEIGPVGFLVYSLVLRRYDHKSGEGIYESHASRAKTLSMSEPTIDKHLRRLVDLVLIRKIASGRRRYEQWTYVPVLPMPKHPGNVDQANTQNDWVKKEGLPKLTRINTQNDEKAGVEQQVVIKGVNVDSEASKRLTKRLNKNMCTKEELEEVCNPNHETPVSQQLQTAWRYWCQRWEDHYGRPYYAARCSSNAKTIAKDKRNLRDKILAVGVAEVILRMERCFEICDTIFPCFVNGRWQRPITLNDFVNNHFFDQWIAPPAETSGRSPTSVSDKVRVAMSRRSRGSCQARGEA